MYKNYFKRFIDFTLTLVGLICISPILVVLCILVRIKLGSPIFFKQVRITKGEKPFKMMKFRTMSDARDSDGNLLPDEDRFTRFGDFLRNSSLDELPELFNVLKGDMSLIGPRPLYPVYLPYYTKEEANRHDVRAGITGLAQINGRNLSKWNDRFAYDIKYVKELSFVNDIKILWRTFFKVASQEDIGQPSVEEEKPLHLCRPVQRPELLNEEDLKKFAQFFATKKRQGIGSDYWISEAEVLSAKNAPYKMLPDDATYFSSCRGALQTILKHIDVKNKVALLPAFTCHAVLEPFVQNGYKVLPYHLNKDLSVDWTSLRKLVSDNGANVVLVHSYFGFDTLKGCEDTFEYLKKNGVIIIEDMTQRVFSGFKSTEADYHVGSLRKWLPIPDGGYLMGIKVNQPNKEDKDLVNIRLQAMYQKAEYMNGHRDDNTFRSLFAESEEIINTRKEPFGMSDVAKRVYSASDLKKASDLRKHNYKFLEEGLCGYPFNMPLKAQNGQEVPFMMPLLVTERRKELQSYLAKNNIFATVIWGCPEEFKPLLNADDKYIYESILCLACDQRYNEEDMKHIVNTIDKFYKI